MKVWYSRQPHMSNAQIDLCGAEPTYIDENLKLCPNPAPDSVEDHRCRIFPDLFELREVPAEPAQVGDSTPEPQPETAPTPSVFSSMGDVLTPAAARSRGKKK